MRRPGKGNEGSAHPEEEHSEEEETKVRGRQMLQEAMRGFRFLFYLNLMQKFWTFGANTMIVRQTSPLEQGVKLNVELLMAAVQFFSKEAFRTAAHRLDITSTAPLSEARKNFLFTLNTGWVATLFHYGLLLITYYLVYPVILKSSPELHEVAAELRISEVVALHFFGCFLEALGDPLLMASSGMALNKLKSSVEAASLIAKYVVAGGLIWYGVAPLVALGWSQVGYGAVALYFYFHFAVVGTRLGKLSLKEMLPRSGPGRVIIPSSVSDVIFQFQLEATMRLILNEGEKMLLSGISVLSQQGVYEVVSHLGSIVCRMLFKFLEDHSIAAWGKLFSIGATKEARRLLLVLLRVLIIIGLIFFCFGPSYSHALLFILYGRKWSDTEAPSLLSLYCVYVSVMGVNGICEAFYRAAAEGEHLRRLWQLQFLCSCAFVVCSLVLAQVFGLGVYGLVISSTLVMLLRIATALRFAYWFLPGFSLVDSVPSTPVFLAAFVSLFVTKISEASFDPFAPLHVVAHIAVGASLFLIFLGVIYINEKSFFLELKHIFSE